MSLAISFIGFSINRMKQLIEEKRIEEELHYQNMKGNLVWGGRV